MVIPCLLLSTNSLKVNFNLKGREWTAPDGDIRYFNSIDAWRIEKIEGTPSNNGDIANNINDMKTVNTSSTSNDDDDLPF